MVEQWRLVDHWPLRTIVEQEAAKTPLNEIGCFQQTEIFVFDGRRMCIYISTVHAQASRPPVVLVKEARA